MSRSRGTTPFDRLRERYETTRKRCPACGAVDDDPTWTCRTDGQRIVYQFVCGSCRAVRDHTYTRG